jgi:hypothetical protein
MTCIDVDLNELQEQATDWDEHLQQILAQASQAAQEGASEDGDAEQAGYPEPVTNGQLSREEKALLERLFDQAEKDRSKAFELKRELDRLNAFKHYEDRFLDLFKTKPDN